MKKRMSRFLSLLLSVVLLLSILPAAPAAQATDETDDYVCDITLTGPGGNVAPFLEKKNWSTADPQVEIQGEKRWITATNIWVYYLSQGGTYTMTTKGTTSTAAVSLIANTTEDITLVLDNVSFDVAISPERSTAFTIMNDENTYYFPGVIEIVHPGATTPDFNVVVKGTNTLNASTGAADNPLRGVLSVQGVAMTITGYDTGGANALNISYTGTSASGSSSPLGGIYQARSRYSDGTNTAATFTIGGDVAVNIGSCGGENSMLGGADGIVLAGQLVLEDGADVSIHSSRSQSGYGGVDAVKISNSRQEQNALWVKDAKLTVKADRHRGIYVDLGNTVFDDGSEVKVSAAGRCIYNASQSESFEHESLIIGDNAAVELVTSGTGTAQDSTILLDDTLSGIAVGENSNVTIINTAEAIGSNPTIHMDGGHFTIGSGSVVDITGRSYGINLGGATSNEYTDSGKLILESGATLKVTTTQDNNYSGEAAVRLYGNGMHIAEGATLIVNSAGDYGVSTNKSYYHDSALEIDSGNVLIRASVAAFHDISKNSRNPLTPGVSATTEIRTYYSEEEKTWDEKDTVTWTEFTDDAAPWPWFKTATAPHTHRYTASYEHVSGTAQHYGICACGAKSPEAVDCTYPERHYSYSCPSATKDGLRTWRCTLCEGRWEETVPAHDCTQHVSQWEESSSAQHKGICTYQAEGGYPCARTVYTDHTFTDWAGDSLTIRRECTACHRVETKKTHENVIHMEAVEGDCSQPGRIEFWHCTDADCGLYFSNELLTQVVDPEDTFTIPGPHTYGEDGKCTVCGEEKQTLTFVRYEDDYYSSDMEGSRFIFVGFKDGKAYAMGNKTNADGSREAVEVPVKTNGAIATDSATAEFFTLTWNPVSFSPDNGYMTMLDGRIVVYDKERLEEDGLPEPIRFRIDSYEERSGWLYQWTNDACIVFDEQTLTFRVTEDPTAGVYCYKQVCPHTNLSYYPAADPTCTEQGVREYWYCGDCYKYYVNNDLEIPAEGDEYGNLTPADFTIPALCHSYGTDDTCENCGMLRPVYKPITSLEQFDALSEDASFLIAFEDLEAKAAAPGTEGESLAQPVFSGKTYAAFIPDYNHYQDPTVTDADANGVVDLLETDENGDGVPDFVAILFDLDNGGDRNGDGNVDSEDHKLYAMEWLGVDRLGPAEYAQLLEGRQWTLMDYYDSRFLDVPNLVEVQVAADGTITLTDEGAMEFRLMESGTWGGQPADDSCFEEDGILETDRVRAAWIPNYWIANSGVMSSPDESLMFQRREYGDGEYPGVLDNRNWKISFREDGTVSLVCGWTSYDETAALQLVHYTDAEGNDRISMVGCYGSQWQNSECMSASTAMLPATLYAAEPAYGHVHRWSPWQDNADGMTHSRICDAEGCAVVTQTREHAWDNGVQTVRPTCMAEGEILFTCRHCGAEKTAPTAKLSHDWSWWEAGSNGETHMMYCRNRGCTAVRAESHDWRPGTEGEEDRHICQVCYAVEVHRFDSEVIQWNTCVTPGQSHDLCSVCGYETYGEIPIDPEAHDWGEWTVVTPSDEGVEGEEKRVCRHAPEEHVQTRPIPALGHEHTFSDWEPYDDETHRQLCMSETCSEYTEESHDLAEEVLQEAGYGIPGQVRIYCRTCWYERILTQEPLQAEPEETTAEPVECQAQFITTTVAPDTLSIQAVEVVPTGAAAPVNAYEQYVLNSMDGYLVDTIYDVSAQNSQGQAYELAEGESVTVTLTVGSDNAQRLLDKELLLVHVVGLIRDVYSLSELTIDVEAGTVTFTAHSLSPFVLALPPAELTVTVKAEATDGGTDVELSTNASYLSNLFVAAYDADDRMLAVKAVGSCNLLEGTSFVISHGGTAAYVKAYLLEAGGFVPRQHAIAENIAD